MPDSYFALVYLYFNNKTKKIDKKIFKEMDIYIFSRRHEL